MDKKKKGRNRKKTVIAIVLVLMVGILGTFAYLGTRSNDATNTFTGSSKISLMLVEPDWNSQINNKPKKESEYANDYAPGQRYQKNPMLYNDSDNDTNFADGVYEWVAMKVEFKMLEKPDGGWTELNPTGTCEAVTWEEFQKVAKIQRINGTTYEDGFNIGTNKNWILIATSSTCSTTLSSLPTPADIVNADNWAIFLYKTSIKNKKVDGLPNGTQANTFNNDSLKTLYGKDESDVQQTSSDAITTPLFDAIKINNQQTLVGNEYRTGTVTELDKVVLPKFEIGLSGAGIKNESFKSPTGGSTTDVSLETDFTQLTSADQENVKADLLRLLGVTFDSNYAY